MANINPPIPGGNNQPSIPNTGVNIPGGAPAVPSGAPSIPGGAPAIPGGTPSVPSGAPAVPGGAPAVPGGAPAIPSGTPATPSSIPTPNQQSDYLKQIQEIEKMQKAAEEKRRVNTAKAIAKTISKLMKRLICISLIFA